MEEATGTAQEKEVLFTREEVLEVCRNIAGTIRECQTAINTIHDRLYDTIPEEDELLVVWNMGGDALEYVQGLLYAFIPDVENGGYLPKPIEGAA